MRRPAVESPRAPTSIVTLRRVGARPVRPPASDRVVPEWLLALFARYGYFVVFAGVFLENTGLPVPGETALLAGAALSHYGRLSLTRVIVTAIVAATLGD